MAGSSALNRVVYVRIVSGQPNLGVDMPLGKGVRYRWKTNKDGSKTRLAFRGKKVIEVKAKGGKAKKV